MLEYTVTFVDGMSVVHVLFPARRSNTGHVGVHKMHNGRYQVCKGKHILGWRGTLEEAVALRTEADCRKRSGTYDEWYAAILAQRKK